jgi:outer membrane receptor protein involved in Fe transport
MVWGTDLSADVPLGTRASVFATYSWAKYDSLSNEAPELSVSPAVPNHKASFALTYGRPATWVRSSLRIRAVGPFGAVAGYAVTDLSSTFRVPRTRALSLTAEVQNLFDHGHRETGGGAFLGRLAILRTRLEF